MRVRRRLEDPALGGTRGAGAGPTTRRFRRLTTCRGARPPDVATYLRVSVPDVTRCSKTGLCKPSMNSSDDHETVVAEPKLRQNRRQENPRKADPATRARASTPCPPRAAPRGRGT